MNTNVIQDMLGSKKFVAALVALISAVAVKLGAPETEVSEIIALISPLLVYVGAQGFADIGKHRKVADLVVTNTTVVDDEGKEVPQ